MATYRRNWISLSSSVILFNKYVLDTAGFRELEDLTERGAVLTDLSGYRTYGFPFCSTVVHRD